MSRSFKIGNRVRIVETRGSSITGTIQPNFIGVIIKKDPIGKVGKKIIGYWYHVQIEDGDIQLCLKKHLEHAVPHLTPGVKHVR